MLPWLLPHPCCHILCYGRTKSVMPVLLDIHAKQVIASLLLVCNRSGHAVCNPIRMDFARDHHRIHLTHSLDRPCMCSVQCPSQQHARAIGSNESYAGALPCWGCCPVTTALGRRGPPQDAHRVSLWPELLAPARGWAAACFPCIALPHQLQPPA